MKTRLKISLALIALVTMILAWSAWASPAREVSHFAISVETQSDGSFKARCESGCGWKELHYSCNGKVPCCSRVDEHGVHGMKECPAAAE